MAEVAKGPIDKLIDYINTRQDISKEDLIEALKIISNKNNTVNPRYRDLLLKIIELINKRTDEANDFVEIVNNKMLDEETKKALAMNKIPFKDGNIQIEKMIIEIIYGADEPYKELEDLLIDLIYEYPEDPDELKEKLKNMLTSLGVNTDIKDPEQEDEKIGYFRFRI